MRFRLAVDGKMALASAAAVIAATAAHQPELIGGISHMDLNARMDALKERHASLESRIFDEDHRPRPDTETLTRLKIEKLHIKEEIEKIRLVVNSGELTEHRVH
jgi:hypothetical protein